MTNSPTPRIDRMMGYDSATMGDEREARIVLQATSFGAVVSVYTTIAVAAGLALTGNGAWGAVLLILSSIPSFAIYFYAGRHGVDVDKLLSKGTMGQLVWPQVIVGVMVAALLFGIVFHLTTGHPVIPVPDVTQVVADSMSPDRTASLPRGLIGGGIVALIAIVWTVISARRTKAKKVDPADIPDED
ncbi:hypothetical protein [Brevibacterium ravenspurgense]|uniref:hypothetical protein n=1 Tax=Brevibacterium ravenspurgense TaxID=479117 RepID=UPI0002D7503B|nr:hypothetical protein [Brevibacterium ravenspurgense]HJH13368.1 hypothetical protein [Brevibacterium ravenspurgense]